MNTQPNFMNYRAPEFIALVTQGQVPCETVGYAFENAVSRKPDLIITNQGAQLLEAAETYGLSHDPLYYALALVLTTNMTWPLITFQELIINAYASRTRGGADTPAFPQLHNPDIRHGLVGRSVPLVALSKATGIELPLLLDCCCTGEIRLQFATSPDAFGYVGVHVRDALLLAGHKF
jgi:hypothetical protein